jgi:predicted DNA-binding transcriptional regulator YafY
MKKLENLFKIIYLLHSGNIVTANTIGDRLGISARNARAYVTTLMNTGIPIGSLNGRRGGYYLDKEYFLQAPDLTERELIALRILREMMDNASEPQFTAEMISAISKILLIGKNQEFGKIEQFKDGHSSSQNILPLFQVAIELKKKIKIAYLGMKDERAIIRIICPHQIEFRDNTWYVYAYCEMRKEKRLFSIMRIQKAELLNVSFHMDDDEALNRDMGKAFGLFRGQKEYTVKIRFDYPASQWVKEHLWIENQQIEELADKAIIYTCLVEGLDTIERWILRYGDMARVLEPEELRDKIKETLKRTLNLY